MVDWASSVLMAAANTRKPIKRVETVMMLEWSSVVLKDYVNMVAGSKRIFTNYLTSKIMLLVKTWTLKPLNIGPFLCLSWTAG